MIAIMVVIYCNMCETFLYNKTLEGHDYTSVQKLGNKMKNMSKMKTIYLELIKILQIIAIKYKSRNM